MEWIHTSLIINEVKTDSSPWFSATCAAVIAHSYHIFCLHQQNKSSESNVKLRQDRNHCKRILKAAKLAYANKTSLSLPRNLALMTFGESLIVFSTKVNLLELLYSTAQRYFLLRLIKQKCLQQIFLGTLILMTQVSLVFPSSPNLKVHSLSMTSKLVQKVITNLNLSEASDPDCIPVVVLKNCEPELSDIFAELFIMYLKESCFPDCWKISLAVPVLKNVGKRCTAKNYGLASLLSVSKS